MGIANRAHELVAPEHRSCGAQGWNCCPDINNICSRQLNRVSTRRSSWQNLRTPHVKFCSIYGSLLATLMPAPLLAPSSPSTPGGQSRLTSPFPVLRCWNRRTNVAGRAMPCNRAHTCLRHVGLDCRTEASRPRYGAQLTAGEVLAPKKPVIRDPAGTVRQIRNHSAGRLPATHERRLNVVAPEVRRIAIDKVPPGRKLA